MRSNKIIIHFACGIGFVCTVLFITVSMAKLSDSIYSRLQTVQDMQVGALDTSSNVADRIKRPEFWKKGIQYRTDNFYPMYTDIGRSVLPNYFTKKYVTGSPQGFGAYPVRRFVQNDRKQWVYSVGRAYKIDVNNYELHAEVNATDVLGTAWPLLSAYLIAFLGSLFAWYFSIKFAGTMNVDELPSETRLKQRIMNAVLNELADGVAAVNEDGIVLFTNDTFNQIMGYKRGETEGISFNAFVSKDRAKWHTSQMQKSFKESKEVSYRMVEPYRKDGSQTKVELGIKIASGHYRGKRIAIATIREK